MVSKIKYKNIVYNILETISIGNKIYVIIINNPNIEYVEFKNNKFIEPNKNDKENEILKYIVNGLKNNIKNGKYKVIGDIKKEIEVIKKSILVKNLQKEKSVNSLIIDENLNMKEIENLLKSSTINEHQRDYLNALYSYKLKQKNQKVVEVTKTKKPLPNAAFIDALVMLLITSLFGISMFILIAIKLN